MFEGRETRLRPAAARARAAAESGDARRGHLFESVAALLGRLSERAPLVLILEDVHWADRSTRDLIGFLIRSTRCRTSC